MTAHDLLTQAERMESRISAADRDQRLALQPQFSLILEQLEEQGEPVPKRLLRLEAALTEEAIEDRFDNMPI
ncbi:MAG: hypothetical protein P1U75_05625 [Antarcticimicrobium sp.]|uniref:hypothetical protein n=1 Tax=Antarcticimicrobium sp. TaxID=2824147 RepID=UPI0026198D28|nr:hypothetical protein [Antarcticimicrobium sp.]MDF1716137.1 hypothetical protein [Antarcticimicrobium sp.]